MRVIKCIALILASLSMIFLTTGCNEEDVIIGTGLIVIGAAKVATGSKKYPGRYHRRNHRRHGRIHRRGSHHRRGHHRGGHHHRRNGYHFLNAEVSSDLNNSALDIRKVSSQFGLEMESAAILISAIEMSLDGDITALEEIGFSEKDQKRMSKFKLPKAESIQRIAYSLNQEPVQTKAMLKSLIDESKVQAKDINSYLWQSCMAEGAWKTPQNMYCKNTAWKGCAPFSGATTCVPAKVAL